MRAYFFTFKTWLRTACAFSVFLLFSCGQNNKATEENNIQPKGDLAEFGLIGNVKSVAERAHSDRDEGPVFWDITYFNERGLKTEEASVYESAEKRVKAKYIYSADGRLIEIHRFDFGAEENSKDVIEYNNLLKTKITYYDITSNNRDSLNYYTEFEYDSLGRKISVIYFSSDSSVFDEEYLEYYENNKVKARKKNDYSSGLLTHTYKYNEIGNCIEEKVCGEDEPCFSYQFTYDERNNEVSIKKIRADGSTQYEAKVTYEYDKNGNWIKKRTTGMGVPINEERQVVYY